MLRLCKTDRYIVFHLSVSAVSKSSASYSLYCCSDTSLFPYFLEFIKTGGDAEEASLLKELRKIDEFLSKSSGNFFGGKDVNALDMQIAPKLKHISIGAKAVHVRTLNSRDNLVSLQLQDKTRRKSHLIFSTTKAQTDCLTVFVETTT